VDATERISMKLSIVVYTQNSSGNFNSGSHIFSENYVLQEPEISLRIFSNKVEFCTYFVALPPPQYTHIYYVYIYIYIYKFSFNVFSNIGNIQWNKTKITLDFMHVGSVTSYSLIALDLS